MVHINTLNDIKLTINLALTNKIITKIMTKYFKTWTKSFKEINGLDASFDFQPLWSIHTCESYPHRLEIFPKIICWHSFNEIRWTSYVIHVYTRTIHFKHLNMCQRSILQMTFPIRGPTNDSIQNIIKVLLWNAA